MQYLQFVYDFARHLTGYFGSNFSYYGSSEPKSVVSGVTIAYGEADVCSKCNQCTNFVAAKDLTKATPAVNEGKSYTQDEAKKIPLKDEKGETVDKNSYTVSVETSKTDENKWVVVFDPISGRSTGKITIDVVKANAHNHTYIPKIITPATCTEEGEMTYTCKCGHSYTDDRS